jgi:hypothetical protein
MGATSLQQWALQHPELFGEILCVITDEFDRWEDVRTGPR